MGLVQDPYCDRVYQQNSLNEKGQEPPRYYIRVDTITVLWYFRVRRKRFIFS